jgi:hypothetical protein
MSEQKKTLRELRDYAASTYESKPQDCCQIQAVGAFSDLAEYHCR